MGHQAVVNDYLECFCSGDVDGVAATLGDEFRLRGPLFEFDSREEYLQSLRDDALEKVPYSVLESTAGDDTVSVIYEYQKTSGSITIAQFFRLKNEKIVETMLVFDAGAE